MRKSTHLTLVTLVWIATTLIAIAGFYRLLQTLIE